MKTVNLSLLLFFLSVAFAAGAQSGNRKGYFYFALGTHKAFYSKSDIHLVSNVAPAFDFTLQKVKAKDDFFLKGTGGAPQYDYQMGYYSTKRKFGIEFNFAHVKYLVRHNQEVRIEGTVNGQKINDPVPVTAYVQNFEHTDGANYALFNFVKRGNVSFAKQPGKIEWGIKAGAGPVVPKTNSTVLGKHWDDHYKIAGYVVALETGLRYNFYKSFFVEPSFRGAHANYKRFLIVDGHGNQKWISAQFILSVGTRFGL